MVKQVFFVAIASILVVLGLFVIEHVFYSLSVIYDYVFKLLGLLFSKNDAGMFIQHALSLFLLPILITLAVGIPVWLVKKDFPAFLIPILWGSWLIVLSMLVWR